MRDLLTLAVVLTVVLAGCGGGVTTDPNGTADGVGTDTATETPVGAGAGTQTGADSGSVTEAGTPDSTTSRTTGTDASVDTPDSTASGSNDGPDSDGDPAPAGSSGDEDDTVATTAGARESTTTATATSTATTTETATRTPTSTARPTTMATSTARPTTSTTAVPTETPTATPEFSDRTEWTVTVVRVVDGDTLEVRFPDGHTENVRLLGVDTPEVHVENTPDEFEGIPVTDGGRDHLRSWGREASTYATSKLAGEEVAISTDPAADRRGGYGRLLVYVDHEGTDFNRRLLSQGYARLYESEFSRYDAYATAERTAQRDELGLWNYGAPETATPTSTRTPTATPPSTDTPGTSEATSTPVTDGGSSGDLAVAEVHADAPGNDHDNLNEEYVVFENAGDSAVDLSGWTVTDAADHDYSFPALTLRPGERVTLYTGSGTDGDGALYWGSGRAVWNNGGDTITVRDETGTVVVERTY
ncbi:lamin tail domain-containing protein [Halobium salinum]|uniref:Lamin tail domain-containing protein n=1 Tax=Halobium salinum TaxID=1364940 RepID=A0ABD5PGF8_9EURY|nr:lamin tail domain-containing protein [Halobium salinum]